MTYRSFLIPAVALAFSASTLAHAAPASGPWSYLGMGALAHNAGKTATDASTGETPLLGDLYSDVSLTGLFRLGGRWALSPHILYNFMSTTSPEKEESTSVFALGVRAVYSFSDAVDIHVGPSVLQYTIRGGGGTVTLDNGSGTSPFGIPDDASTGSLVCWDVGLGVTLGRVRVDGAVLVSGAFSSETRAFNPYVSLSWGVF
jgi:hypothetical protein